jgi:hypothetical protein
MRLAKRYLLEAVLLVLCGGVVWALGPYLDIFSGDTYLSDAAWEDLAVETKGRFGQRFFVGAQIGAAVTVLWILCDLAKRRRAAGATEPRRRVDASCVKRRVMGGSCLSGHGPRGTSSDDNALRRHYERRPRERGTPNGRRDAAGERGCAEKPLAKTPGSPRMRRSSHLILPRVLCGLARDRDPFLS